jgi:transcriptional/translational regulatory protein YebC/TACO1
MPKEGSTEDALMEAALEAGADDVITTEEGFEVRCEIHAFDRVSHALEAKGIKPESAEIAYIPTSTVPVDRRRRRPTLVKFHDALEELDDVQQVFSNEEMDEAVSAAAHS